VSTEERLLEAIQDGEIIKIIYHGGSRPGALREIAPMSIKDGLLWARCYTSHAVKCFGLRKIDILEGDAQPTVPEWQPGGIAPEKYNSIAEVLQDQQDLLTQLGWHMEHSDTEISLHRKNKKTGIPLKGKEVRLFYEEFRHDSIMDIDGGFRDVITEIKKLRPWTVKCKDQITKTYSHLGAAVDKFIEYAKSLAPTVKGK